MTPLEGCKIQNPQWVVAPGKQATYSEYTKRQGFCGLKYSNCTHLVSDTRLEWGRYEPHFHPKLLYAPA
jgi:hypothetical protein